MSCEIHTGRLVLRAYTPGDAASIAAGLSDIAVSRWLGRAPSPYTLADAQDFLDGPGMDWPHNAGIFLGGRHVGGIGTHGGELGYWLCRDAWGQGYATEAARAVVASYFDRNPPGIALSAGYFEGNSASHRILSKLGFVEIARNFVHCAALDRSLPHVAMRLDRPAWKAAA